MAFTKLDGLNGGADTNESSAANSVVANTVRWNPASVLRERSINVRNDAIFREA